MLSSCRLDLDVDAPAFLVEENGAFLECKQRVIFAHTNIASGMELGSDLTDEDGTSGYLLAAESLDSASLCVAVASVAGRALTFLVCHR